MILAGPVGGYFLGNWLDSKFETSPYLMIICSLVGLVASIRETIKLLGQLTKADDDEENTNDF